jgi:hypothetical protein
MGGRETVMRDLLPRSTATRKRPKKNLATRWTEPVIPADQNADYDSLAKENRRLKELNDDLHHQNSELRGSRLLSPIEEESIKALRVERDMLNADAQKLALWLRGNKEKEIRQGKHIGMSLAEVCIMYMAKGLD